MMRVADQVVFYTGMFKPHLAQHVRRAMLSYNCLEKRKGDFAPPALDWMLDSGAFTRIVSGRGHVLVAEYAAAIRRWEQVGRLRAAVSQDYMCDDFVLGTTGLSVREHQDLTTGRYLELLDALGEQPYVMPVIQGYAPDEYAYHCWTLAPHLPEGALVGVGSICKRNSRPEAVAQVLNAVLSVRPDLRLHAFGLKTTALQRLDIAERLHSADSMAWSYDARRSGVVSHSVEHARMWTERIERLPLVDSQLPMLPRHERKGS